MEVQEKEQHVNDFLSLMTVRSSFFF